MVAGIAAEAGEGGRRGVRGVPLAWPPAARPRPPATPDEFTEWDGFVRAARALLDPRVSGEAGVRHASRAAGPLPVPLFRGARPRSRGSGGGSRTATSGSTRCRGAPSSTRSSPACAARRTRAGAASIPAATRSGHVSSQTKRWPRCARSVPRPRRSCSTVNAGSCFATWSCSSSSKQSERTASRSPSRCPSATTIGGEEPLAQPRPDQDHPRQG